MPAVPLLIAGFQGTGKSHAASRFEGVGEIIDAERLQARAARALDPQTSNAYDWGFWSGDRVLSLPRVLNEAFEEHHGTFRPSPRFVVLEASILVKDWYLSALMGVLHLHRPDLLWSRAEFLMLDFDPALIHAQIQARAEKDRPHEKSITLADVRRLATGYRDYHAKRSMFPWKFLADPAELDATLRGIFKDDQN